MHTAKSLTVLILLAALVLSAPVFAQSQKSDTQDKQESGAVLPDSKTLTPPRATQAEIETENQHARRSSSQQTSKRSPSKHRGFERGTPVSNLSSPSAVTLVTRSPEYISGEANVTVKGNENPIIRLGLALSGVALIEFPASDRFFALHPGNSDMVTIDESPTKQNDHFFVFRAGSSFVPPPASQTSIGPSASIIAQMRSGMVVTFLIYPVRELSQMAHRVVILYDRAEVVVARRAAGLAVNLEETNQQQAQRSIRIAAQPDSPSAQTEPIGDGNTTEVRPRTAEPHKASSGPDDDPLTIKVVPATASGRSFDPKFNVKTDLDLGAEARKALKLAITTSKFKNWTRPSHGLSLATSNPKELSGEDSTAIVIVAVRNVVPEPLRIVPGQPDISIDTRDDKGNKTVLVEQIKPLHVESSGLGDSIPAGATLYYAIVYRRPVLGVHQRLRVTIGQINAADDPAVADLTTSAK